MAHSGASASIPTELVGKFDFDLLQPLSTHDREHMIGARSGLIHALLAVRKVIARESPDATYREIPLRFTRKRREAQRVTDALRLVEADIDRQQKGCADRLKADDFQTARADAAALPTAAPVTSASECTQPSNKEKP